MFGANSLNLRQTSVVMSVSFSQRVAQFIDSYHLLQDRDRIIVGLSGGADSVALLHVMASLGYKCEAAHCNFHLRGSESDRDEKFCRELCKSLDIAINVMDFDVNARCKSSGESVEMACRSLRYEWWESLLSSGEFRAVAVGHHMEDNVETLMLNLLRGSGLSGLKGMLPRRGNIIRPLLDVSRDDIETYLESAGLKYVTDSSNMENDYKRNRLRNIILPSIEKLFPGAMRSISASVGYLRGNFELYNDFVGQLCDRYIRANGAIDISSILIQERHPKMVLYELLSRVGLNMTHTENILSAMSGDKGCPASGKVFRSQTMSYLLDRGMLIPIEDDRHGDLCPEASVVDIHTAPFSYREMDYDEFSRIRNYGKISVNKIYFDSSILEGNPEFRLRGWQKGDRIKPFGMAGSRLVSDIMSDAKLSVADKTKVRILLRNSEIIWVVGMRASRLYEVKPGSEKVIELTYVAE